MLKKINRLEMVVKFLNLKFFFLIIFLATYIFKHAFSEENYIVYIVNNIPITKVDIHNRAKLISISINQNSKIKNIENYYNQSLQTLINEKVILSAGKKIIRKKKFKFKNFITISNLSLFFNIFNFIYIAY